ncbi:MAG: ABC transporter ATP-binding protein [Burkholderiaceae bacterium]
MLLDGEDLVGAGEERLMQIRGNDISMVFQEPMTSLNPVFSIGEQIAETVRQHTGASRRTAHDRAIEMLQMVGIPAAGKRVNDFPHQMSGGMRQRVMIAIALACEPRLLIADEPTTALDVTIQAQIFDLFLELQQRMGTAVILITHDIGVIARMAQRVMVMYAGNKVEEGPVRAVLDQARHPYTQGLIACVPHLRANAPDDPEPLLEIPGVVPGVAELARPGCPFADRCAQALDRCGVDNPPMSQISEHHRAACWLLPQDAAR